MTMRPWFINSNNSCSKIRYPSLAEAIKSIEYIKLTRDPNLKLTAYKCPKCNGYHHAKGQSK